MPRSLSWQSYKAAGTEVSWITCSPCSIKGEEALIASYACVHMCSSCTLGTLSSTLSQLRPGELAAQHLLSVFLKWKGKAVR